MYNKYFIGDNLQLLEKLIQENYKFQLIYLDPPYNTGRDFNDFNDKFADLGV
jgi:adenine-specific DNA-methyltransferase